MTPRRLLVATLLLAFGYVPTADAAPPALKGATVVTGSAIGAMRVRLPRAASVSLESTQDLAQGADATFSGGGRLLALGLLRGDRDETWFTRSNVCMTRGCSGPVSRFFGVHWKPDGVDVASTTLPAGNYTLYWISDGKPASVTLRLTGLSGRTTLRPAPLRATQWGPGAMQDTIDPVTMSGVRTYDGNTEFSLPKGGLVVDVEWVVSDRMSSRASMCVFSEGETQPPVGCVTRNGGGYQHASQMFCLCITGGMSTSMGFLGFWRLGPGKYVMQSDAQYTGTFGHTGLAIAAVPLL